MELADGSKVPYDRLLLATGAEAVRLPIPGVDLPHVHTLRTLADCRAIIARAASARRAVVMGDCVVRYKQDGRVVAVATIYLDVESLRTEVEMERTLP
ncbi:FAD-dependent oxidoreductase [Paraburkholderia sp. CNPSo 3274]|uniref:FAD-dependent oxidoreductase n=1 Tax=Paraburkholderia sp. CNPSo 3274 TaxID=2940932 RepID=UPI0035CCE5FF